MDWIEGKAQMEEILRREAWGVLGVIVDGEPYCVPLNHAYVDGKILFHCALEGRKLDGIRATPRVSFTVAWQSGEVKPHECRACHPSCDSVMCHGPARIVEDVEEKQRLLNVFNRAFRPDAKPLELNHLLQAACVEIDVDEMTGRVERDMQYTLYRWRR
jgi:uncharacterized protein